MLLSDDGALDLDGSLVTAAPLAWDIFTSLKCCFTLTSCILAPGSWYLFPSVHLVNEFTEFAALSGFLQEKHSVKSQSLFLRLV